MLEPALRADLPRVVAIWVDAFAADPYLRWIAPDDADWVRFGPAWMGFIAGHCLERGHTFVGPDAAVAWIPPDRTLLDAGGVEEGRAILAAHAGEQRASEAVAAITATRAHAVPGPHWTLQYLGVRRAAAGRGLGREVLGPTLAAIDRDRLPCGLTSTNPRNVTFYERLGFRVVAEVDSPDGAVTLRPMVREPAPTDVEA